MNRVLKNFILANTGLAICGAMAYYYATANVDIVKFVASYLATSMVVMLLSFGIRTEAEQEYWENHR